jgi:hypothetical protein
MTRQNSESQLGGHLAASLTPRVSSMPKQHRREQLSGLIDIGALYAASVEQVMNRARAARPPVVAHARPHAAHFPAQRQQQVVRNAYAVRYDDAALLEAAGVLPRRGVGWFGVAVAWLATAVIGATVATTVPAHANVHTHLAAIAPVAAAPSAPLPVARPVAVPTPALPSGEVSVESLPLVTATNPSSVTTSATPSATPKALPKVAPQAHSHVASAPPEAPAPAQHAEASAAPTRGAAIEKAPPAEKAAPADKAPAAEAPPAKAAAASAPAPAPGSLEDLMRRAVEADAKASAKRR